MAAGSKILFLSPCWPLGKTFGGQMRALHTARALAEIGEVTFVVVGSNAHDEESSRVSAEEFRVEQPIPTPRLPERHILEQLRWALDVSYLNVHGVAAEPAATARLLSLLRDFDLVWVLNARTPNLMRIWRWPHSHLDVDDLPSTYAGQVARTAPHPLARWKARIQRHILHRREKYLPRRFTTLSVCSEADRSYLGHAGAHVIPNGFQRPVGEPCRKNARHAPRIGFIGLYSYAPNAEGVRWFLQHAWPLVRRAVPGVRFRVVGRDSDGPDRPDAPDTDALGWLENPDDEIATWSAMIIPIHVGGGTRIKLPYAFSRKCPVVSTRFGAYGYHVTAGQELLLADTADAFARSCIHVLQHEDEARRMTERAWRTFVNEWTWDAIAPRVRAAAEDCLRQGRTPSTSAPTAGLAMGHYR